MKLSFGEQPVHIAQFDRTRLNEVMYYLYLPIKMIGSHLRLPTNVRHLLPLVAAACSFTNSNRRKHYWDDMYVYLSARKGWATRDNPLNRPGWHCDGFGSDDMNFVWWDGPGTRFALQPFFDIPPDHLQSQLKFQQQVNELYVRTPPEHGLYYISPECVHATPVIDKPCMRSYVKISVSRHQYNLEDNSHNYLFDYAWKMHKREDVRNDPHKAQLDHA